MRFRLIVAAVSLLILLVPSALCDELEDRLEHCLPWPTYAEELAQMGLESRVDVELRQLEFVDSKFLPNTIQQQIRSSLLKVQFTAKLDDPEVWVEELEERVLKAWREHGFFRALVQTEPQVLQEELNRRVVAATVHIEEGQQYRLGDLRFRNNRVFSSDRLRPLFSLRAGDIFAIDQIGQGLDNLRRLYGTVGYINFTSIPVTTVDDTHATISLEVDVDEGKPFRLGEIRILGFGEEASKKLIENSSLKPRDLYNRELVEQFYKENATGLPADPIRHIEHHITEPVQSPWGTVDITFDFRRSEWSECPWADLDADHK